MAVTLNIHNILVKKIPYVQILKWKNKHRQNIIQHTLVKIKLSDHRPGQCP
jgi:hypothetical protein